MLYQAPRPHRVFKKIDRLSFDILSQYGLMVTIKSMMTTNGLQILDWNRNPFRLYPRLQIRPPQHQYQYEARMIILTAGETEFPRHVRLLNEVIFRRSHHRHLVVVIVTTTAHRCGEQKLWQRETDQYHQTVIISAPQHHSADV